MQAPFKMADYQLLWFYIEGVVLESIYSGITFQCRDSFAIRDNIFHCHRDGSYTAGGLLRLQISLVSGGKRKFVEIIFPKLLLWCAPPEGSTTHLKSRTGCQKS